jgi:hypothetical protein
MNETYAEAGVKRKDTALTFLLRFLLIFVGVVSFILLSVHNTILMIAAVILLVGVIYMFPRLKIEYEYVYCDGQLDFDKIMGNARRKNVMKVDFEQVEIMAPQGSHSLDGYAHLKPAVRDFTSLDKNKKPYVIVTRSGENKTKILFEPSEKMIGAIKMKYPRKIVEY